MQHRLTDDTYRDDRESGAVLGALELRALADEALLGLDLAFGGGFDGGFAYRSAGYLGLAVSPLSGVFLLGAGGLGIDGLTGVVPPALLLPLEGRLAVDAFETRVQLVGRIAAAPTSRQRRGGTFRFPFADEASLGLHVTTPEVEVLDSNLRFGVSLGEQLGANLWTISVGVGGMLADRL